MGAVYYNTVHMGFYQSRRSLKEIGGNAQSRSTEKTSLGILCGIRVFDLLFYILDSDKAL